MAAFAEVTRTGHGHGGSGWELGKCLWHQAKTRGGQDRNAAMRQPKRGDRIFHLVAGLDPSEPRRRFLWGTSIVRDECQVTSEPPNPGDWPDRGDYYRIDLEALKKVEPPVPLDRIESSLSEVILKDLGPDRPKYYLYSPHKDAFRITQGIYLTILTPALEKAFERAVA